MAVQVNVQGITEAIAREHDGFSVVKVMTLGGEVTLYFEAFKSAAVASAINAAIAGGVTPWQSA